MESRAGSCRLVACPVPPRRSRRTSMSHTDLGQPDLAALRAAGDAESAGAEAGLVSSCRYPLTGAGARPGPLAHRGGFHPVPLRCAWPVVPARRSLLVAV